MKLLTRVKTERNAETDHIVYRERWTGFYQILSNNTQYHNITYTVQNQPTQNVAPFIYLFIFAFFKLLWLDNKQKESIQVTFEAVMYAAKD